MPSEIRTYCQGMAVHSELGFDILLTGSWLCYEKIESE